MRLDVGREQMRVRSSLGVSNKEPGPAGRYSPVAGAGSLGGDPKNALTIGGLGFTGPQLFFACSVLSFLFSTGLAAGIGWGYAVTPRGAGPWRCPSARHPGGPGAARALRADWAKPAAGGAEPALEGSKTCFEQLVQEGGHEHAYKQVYGATGHILPEMYGRVREKTIWSFWNDEKCRSSEKCVIPAHVRLCMASVERNKGDFDYIVLHLDTITQYISLLELPMRWHYMSPVRQKEALMNAIMARYGGVALDITTVLLHPLDSYWDDLTGQRATFRGYMYRVNGQPWSRPEAMATWFLMSRREGLFSTVVRNQVINFWDADRNPDLPLGDHTLTPVVGQLNYSFPNCVNDQSLAESALCPEPVQPRPFVGVPATPRNDRRLILQDPRDGPHLPFAFAANYGMGTWRVADSYPLVDAVPECKSAGECWQKVVLPRYHSGLLVFIKLFEQGGPLRSLGRNELLDQKDTFFYNWLRLAGLSDQAIELALDVGDPGPSKPGL